MFTRRRGLYIPTDVANARDLRAALSDDRDLTAVAREHQWVQLAQDTHHEIRLADVAEHGTRAKRTRRQRAKDAAESAKLADLYRSAKSAGERAKIRAAMRNSAEVRAMRIAMVRKVSLFAGVPVLIAFAAWSTTGVQAGVARALNLTDGDPAWWAAWGVEPALIAIVALIIMGRAMLRTSGGDTDSRATLIEFGALGTSLALNVFGGWAGGLSWASFGGAFAHSLGPVFAAVTALLIGMFDDYVTHADPYKGAQRLDDMDLNEGEILRTEQPTQELQMPSVAQLDFVPGAPQIPAGTQAVARGKAPEKPRKQTQPKPSPATRPKADAQPATSGYAPGEDAGTQAAKDVLEGRAESIRKAAQDRGVSEGTVRNRLKVLQSEGALIAAQVPHIYEPDASVTAGVNGYSHSTPEDN